MPQYNYKDGRVWLQTRKFQPYDLLLPYGMTDITDPAGALNMVREPSPSRRGESIVVDIIRGEPGLPSFNIETRLYLTLNYMLGLRKRKSNFQAHLGACERPDNYNSSQIGLIWENVRRGDANIDRINMLQGDDAPIAVTSPFSAETGPLPVDFQAEFVSARPIAEGQAITDISMLLDDCDDLSVQYYPGDNGYLATEAGSGLYAQADVWYTEDAWETSYTVSNPKPFASGEDISSIVVNGTKNDHRVIVARGTADGSNPAEIAYMDCTAMGNGSWVYSNVGAVNGQYITHLFWLDWTRLYAITNNGYVYRSSNGGATWALKLSTGVVQFNEITALRTGVVWVGGASNTLYLSEDFGDTWTVVSGPSAGAGNAITTVDLTPDGTVLIGNDAGEVYGTYNNGESWNTLQLEGITPTGVDRIRHYGNQVIWAVATLSGGSSRALRSTDGGASFRLWKHNMPTNSGLNALFVVNQDIVHVGGEVQGSQAFLSKSKSNLIGFTVRLLD